MFDGYHGIALHATQGNRASYHGKGKVSWFFSNLSGTWVTFSRNGPEGPSKLMFVQLRQDYCLVVRTPRDSPWARNCNRESYPVEAETQGPVPLATGKLEFLSILNITQVSSHFEALNSE